MKMCGLSPFAVFPSFSRKSRVKPQNEDPLILKRGSYQEAGRGDPSTVQGPQKWQINNHGHQNFIFTKHDNEDGNQCSILFLRKEKSSKEGSENTAKVKIRQERLQITNYML